MKLRRIMLLVIVMIFTMTPPAVAANKDLVKGFDNPNFTFAASSWIEMPSHVKVVMRSGKKAVVKVSWDWEMIMSVAEKPGRYKVQGTLEGYNEVEIGFLTVVAKPNEKTWTLAEDYHLVTEANETTTLKKTIRIKNGLGTELDCPVLWMGAGVKNGQLNTQKKCAVEAYVEKANLTFEFVIIPVDSKGITDPGFKVVLYEMAKKYDRIPYETTVLTLDPMKIKSFEGIDRFEKVEMIILEAEDNKSFLSIYNKIDLSGFSNLKSLKKVCLIRLDQRAVEQLVQNPALSQVEVSVETMNSDGVEMPYAAMNGMTNAQPQLVYFNTSIEDLQGVYEGVLAGKNISYRGLTDATCIYQQLIANQQKGSSKLPDFEVESLESQKAQLEKLENDFISQYIRQDMSDYEKVKTIHDWIANRTTYASEELVANDDVKYASIYQAYGVMKNGRAVCQGYAEAFNNLANKAGVKSIVVIGEADNGVGDGYQGHAWNLVKIEGQYKHIDVTWDDPIYRFNGVLTDTLRYDYFLLTDERIGHDHRWSTINYSDLD